jgi:predicted ribosomally synthesized peptide with SipW-like signal peptide
MGFDMGFDRAGQGARAFGSRHLETHMNNKRTRILLTLGAVLTVASIGIGAVSMAIFTDTESVDATFSTGTIILDATKIDALTLTSANMVPGDSITGSVDVENDGTNELRYSLDSSSTEVSSPNGPELYTALTIDVKTIDVTTPLVKCDNFDGTLLNSAAEILGASNVIFGDPSPTVGTGDRTVAAAATDVLCIRVSLPLATGDTLQGASSVTTLTFNAEQTENN